MTESNIGLKGKENHALNQKARGEVKKTKKRNSLTRESKSQEEKKEGLLNTLLMDKPKKRSRGSLAEVLVK